MDAKLQKAMEGHGYKFYDHAGDAVGMTEEEKHLMDLRIDLARMVRARRQKQGLSQKELAALLGTVSRASSRSKAGIWAFRSIRFFGPMQ
jgi:ribosome-binding protein aMBF1 (putative translation factor)